MSAIAAPASTQPPTLQVSHLDYTLYAGPDSTFEQMIEQARLVATQQIQQGFNSNPQINIVDIQIICDRNVQRAPILMATVSRQDWMQNPMIQQWAKDLSIARFVLGFEPSRAIAENTPSSPNPNGTPPFGTSPFGTPPFGTPPFGTAPQNRSPYGRFRGTPNPIPQPQSNQDD